MKGLFVTIVDVLGIFVPGFLLILGILVFPPLANDLLKEWPTWTILFDFIRVNSVPLGIGFGILSYVLGFLLRLSSIFILQILTYPWWVEKLRSRAEKLEEVLKIALDDKKLSEGIEFDASLRRKYEASQPAPYFSLAKRIVRHSGSALGADTQRLEAEIRFAAGIFIPLLVFVVDGIWMGSLSGYMLAAISSAGMVIVFRVFPSRRIKEVIYNYHMALIVLRYPSHNCQHGSID